MALGCLLAAKRLANKDGVATEKNVCGLGVAFACAVGHSETLLQSFKGFKGFRGFRGFRGLGAGKRQAWTP